MYKKILCILTTITLIISSFTIVYADDTDEEYVDGTLDAIINQEEKPVVNQESGEPHLNSRIAVAYDRDSDMVIWGKNENKRSAMASTTKIMTAIILLENTPDLSKTVIISRQSGGNRWFKARVKKE